MDYKIVILLLLSILSILGSGYLYFKDNDKSFSTIILSFYLLILGLIFNHSFILNFFGPENSHPIIVFYSYLFFALCLTLPPTFYLYVHSLVNKKDAIFNSNKAQILYAPAITLFVINLFSYIALYSIKPGSENYIMIETIMRYCNFISLFFIFLLQNVFFIFSAWRHYNEQKFILDNTESKKSNFTLKWMWSFIMLYTILITMLYLFLLSPLFPGKVIFRIFTLFYVGAVIYFGSKNYEFILENKQTQQLDDGKREKLKHVLIQYMKENKPHLNNELTLNKLAHELGSNSKYLSYVINKEFECNFSSFINSHRINEAKSYLSDPQKNIYTIESIAQMTGFKSKSAFNSAFKKETNLTPSKFKSQHLRNA